MHRHLIEVVAGLIHAIRTRAETPERSRILLRRTVEVVRIERHDLGPDPGLDPDELHRFRSSLDDAIVDGVHGCTLDTTVGWVSVMSRRPRIVTRAGPCPHPPERRWPESGEWVSARHSGWAEEALSLDSYIRGGVDGFRLTPACSVSGHGARCTGAVYG